MQKLHEYVRNKFVKHKIQRLQSMKYESDENVLKYLLGDDMFFSLERQDRF